MSRIYHAETFSFRSEGMKRLQTVIAVATALLALFAALEYHPVLFLIIAVPAALILAMVERVREVEQYAGQMNGSAIVSDGGTFNKESQAPVAPRHGCGVVVHDGGNQRRLDR